MRIVEEAIGGVRVFFTVPNLITLLNLILGFIAILVVEISPLLCMEIIILAMIVDALDGFVARIIKQVSEIGRELDSLADIVSFGVAPAILVLSVAGETTLSVVLAIIYTCCGALRLARFNVYGAKTKEFFEGLPIPAAAFFVSTTVVAFGFPISYVALAIAAPAMISPVLYPTAKTKRGLKCVALVVIMAVVVYMTLIIANLIKLSYETLAISGFASLLAIFGWCYAVIGPITMFIMKHL